MLNDSVPSRLSTLDTEELHTNSANTLLNKTPFPTYQFFNDTLRHNPVHPEETEDLEP